MQNNRTNEKNTHPTDTSMLLKFTRTGTTQISITYYRERNGFYFYF